MRASRLSTEYVHRREFLYDHVVEELAAALTVFELQYAEETEEAVSFLIRDIPRALHAKIKSAAAEREMSMRDLILELVDAALPDAPLEITGADMN